MRTALQMTMAGALTHPYGASTSTPYNNWSLQLVSQGGKQMLYVCTGSHGGCAGNTNAANGPLQVHVSAIAANVSLTINGAALTCLAFSPLGQPLLGAPPQPDPPNASNPLTACYWPAAVNGQWTFTSTANGGTNPPSSSYVF
ncbi:MAG: hypothetical protein ACYDEV_12895 [Acidiferrobacter sp.]